MTFYSVHFVDHGDNIYLTQRIEQQDDVEAIEAARRMNGPYIGAGFELWQDDRLVHRYRNLVRC